MGQKLITRDLNLEDCERLPALLENVWNIKTTPEYWKWKFFAPPFETGNLVFEDNNGEIVGFTGFWFRPTHFDDQDIYPATIVDVMADPSYRQGRVARFIVQSVEAECNKRFVFGFTNPISHNLFLKKLPQLISMDTRISVYQALIKAGSFFTTHKTIKEIGDHVSRFGHKLRFAWPSKKGLSVYQTNTVDEEFDRLWEETRGGYCWIQRRDREYITWRYLFDPTHTYQVWKAVESGKLVGCMVTTVEQEHGRIRGLFVDWMVPKDCEDVFREMVRTALNWFISQEVDVVETWLMDHEKHWKRVLRTCFFVKAKHSRSLLIAAGPLDKNPKTHAPDNFFFTLGDSDYLGMSRSNKSLTKVVEK